MFYNPKEIKPNQDLGKSKQYSYHGGATQFTNNFIYVSMVSYSGLKAKIHVKFANEYGHFGAITM